MTKVAICTPTRESFLAGFTVDLVYLIKRSPDTLFLTVQGTYLSNLRTVLVRESLRAGASHILFIDSDMRFPDSTIEQLLSHNLDIVGANCAQRTQKQTTARRGDQFIASAGKSGLEEVDTLGFGVTLVRSEVFRNLKQPWFAMPWDGGKHIGEDVYFCHMAKEAGYKIWVDHDLSQKIKHCGLYEYGI